MDRRRRIIIINFSKNLNINLKLNSYECKLKTFQSLTYII